MNRSVAVGLAMVAGFALGTVAAGALKAQGKGPGAYAILDISEVTNPALLKQFLPKTVPAVASAGGRYLARTDKITALVGTPPVRSVVIAFDSVDQAKAWYNSPAMKEIQPLSDQSLKYRWYVAEGVD